MKKSKMATTIAEAMVVTLIIVMGLTGVYSIYSASTKVTNNVETKIKAIQIAREGIEAMTNIRDTNWLIFSYDKKNCWKTFNYTSGCIGNTAPNNIEDNGNYKIYRDVDNRWILQEALPFTDNYTDSSYRNFYEIGLDLNGLYTQTGTITKINNNFTRQIKTTYFTPTGGSVNDGLEVKSIVRWVDSTTTNYHEIELKTILTNHK